jgi:pimeloyl-ACP methyl ester carboxylesterase
VDARTPSGVAYEGRGEGPAVAFVHGLTLDRHTWSPVLDALGDSVRSLAIDLPLHGDSRALTGGMAAATRAVAEVLDHAGAHAPVLVGHSLGAAVVAAVAAIRPARAVILVDQALHLGEFNRRVQTQVEHRAPPPRLDDLLPHFRERLRLDSLDPATRTLVAQHCDPREDLFLAYWGELLEGDADALDRQIESWLRASTAPLLAIHARDPGTAYRAWLAGVAPHASIEVWPEGGHFPHLARPADLAARIRAFLL